jgi:hypothetical protein
MIKKIVKLLRTQMELLMNYKRCYAKNLYSQYRNLFPETDISKDRAMLVRS